MSQFKSEYLKKRRELNDAKDLLANLELEVQKLYKKSVEYDLELKHQEDIEALKVVTTGLNIELVRDFLCANKDADSIDLIGVNVGIQGDGPWGILEFEQFLSEKNFNVTNITDPDVQYLVLGSRNIDEEELCQQITASIEEGFDLYIFTQELFLAWLITGQNPLTNWEEKDLLDSVVDHESLQYLIDSTEFPWPQLVVHETISKSYDVKTFEWDGALSEESPLRKLGYSVQADVLTIQERRTILKNAYTTSALNKFLNTSHDLERWGQPNTAQRLYAMSSLITWLANFQGTTKPAAREKWTSDLSWLKESFYDSKMKFWPQRQSITQAKTVSPSATKTTINPAAAWPFPSGTRP
jgi:hypothetical protein